MKKLLLHFLFGLHALIFLAFPGGFFIPSSLWPARIDWHFYYCLSLFLLYFLWGSLWTFKFRDKIYTICLLDTLMQSLCGHSMWNPQNYKHSFVTELSSRFGLAILCCVLTTFFFILKQKGIILY